MNLFGRSKKSGNTEKVDENSNWNKDLKRNIINKTDVMQQGFEFKENTLNIKVKEVLGIKKGLRLSIDKITQDQVKILKNCDNENTAAELIKILKRTNRTKFKKSILDPLIDFGFFELTIPEKPKSPKQKYRLTDKFISKKSNN